MKKTGLILTLGAAWAAMNLYRTAQRARGDDRLSRMAASTRRSWSPASDAYGSDGSGASPWAKEATADDTSPNAAERLQQRGIAEAPVAAGTSQADAVKDGDLFGSSSQSGAGARAPGLPDFARGA